VLQLAERGLINLDTPVTEYVPYFRTRGRLWARITPRHLLQHTSGLPHGRLLRMSDRGDKEALELAVHGLRFWGLRRAPGEATSYSNLGFMVVGDLVARVSEQPFEAYVGEDILRPLGMTDSTYFPHQANLDLLTTGHMRTGFLIGKPRELKRRTCRCAHAPAGGLYSNVVDLAKWASAHLHGGEFGGARIFTSEAFSRLEETLRAQPNGASVGLGWFLRDGEGHPAFGYIGDTLGYKAHILIVPALDTAAVLLCNALLEPSEPAWSAIKEAMLQRSAARRGMHQEKTGQGPANSRRGPQKRPSSQKPSYTKSSSGTDTERQSVGLFGDCALL